MNPRRCSDSLEPQQQQEHLLDWQSSVRILPDTVHSLPSVQQPTTVGILEQTLDTILSIIQCSKQISSYRVLTPHLVHGRGLVHIEYLVEETGISPQAEPWLTLIEKDLLSTGRQNIYHVSPQLLFQPPCLPLLPCFAAMMDWNPLDSEAKGTLLASGGKNKVPDSLELKPEMVVSQCRL
ncbi:hypothetical protein STEG23_034633 [Scotinomys teguina]